MSSLTHKPIVLAFAGPNGSGKTTVAKSLKPFGSYVNADDLKKEYNLTDLKAAQMAESIRNHLLENRRDFSFETVLSTDRNLNLLNKAKALGYEIQCIYVLTCNENINVARVKARHASGGHDVPVEKIRMRYHLALSLIPRLGKTCDKLLIYDNTDTPALIFCKQGSHSEIIPNEYWTESEIKKLLEL